MFCACGSNKYDSELAQIDSLADVNLDAAKAMYDSIADYIEDDNKSNRMYYKLLRIKIADKSNEEFSSTKEINNIVSFFEGEKDKYRLAESYFYAARTYHRLLNTAEATKYYILATEVDSINMSPGLMVRCFTNLYFISNDNYKLKTARTYAIKASEHANRSFDQKLIIQTYIKLGEAYIGVDDDSAKNYLTEALNKSRSIKDNATEAEALEKIALLYTSKEKYNKALEYINMVDSCCLDTDHREGNYMLRAVIFENLSKFDSALCYYNRAMQTKFITRKEEVCYLLANCYTKMGKAKDAEKMLAEHNRLKGEMVVENDKYSMPEVVKIKKDNDPKETPVLYIGLGVLLIILIFVLVMAYIRRNKPTTSTMSAIDDNENNNTTESISPQPIIFADKKEDTTEKNDIEVRVSNLYLHFMKLADNEQKPNADDWETLDSLINELQPDFMTRIARGTSLSMQEYRTCMLLKLGIAYPQISVLLNCSVNAIYNMCRRMSDKTTGIKRSAKEWAAYIRDEQ